MKHCKLIDRLILSGMAIALACEPASSQTRVVPRPPSPVRTSETNRFIVAFELSPDKGFAFTWPYETMRPAPYESVLMVVETMPRVMDRAGSVTSLRASQSLKVNGRLQKPLPGSKSSDRNEQFEVRLSQGRLRVSLAVPAGFTLDRQYKTARIKLYQINENRVDRPPRSARYIQPSSHRLANSQEHSPTPGRQGRGASNRLQNSSAFLAIFHQLHRKTRRSSEARPCIAAMSETDRSAPGEKRCRRVR